MTLNVTHDTDLWDGDHHVTSLSGCDMHLEADAKVLATSLKRLACFIQKRSLKGRSIEQFPSVLGISSYVWRLLQAVSEAGWDCFKISPQPDAPTLVEAMRTVYGPVPVFFFSVHQFITRCSVAVCGRLSTTGSLQF